MNLKLEAFFLILFFAANVFAAPGTLNFQARIKAPRGIPLEVTTPVDFLFTWKRGTCTLYKETYQVLSMAGTGGLVNFQFGATTANRTYPLAASTTTLKDIFNHLLSSTLTCEITNAAPVPPLDSSEVRELYIQFIYAGSGGWNTLAPITINSVPFAMFANRAEDAEKISGLLSSDLTLKTDVPNCVAPNVLTKIAGVYSCTSSGAAITSADITTALSYTPQPQNLNLTSISAITGQVPNQIIKWSGSAWVASTDNTGTVTETDPTVQAFSKNAPSANFTTTSNILDLADMITAGTNFTKFNVDAKGRIISASLLNSADITTALTFSPLSASGTIANATTAVNFSGILSGDISGTQSATTINNGAVTLNKLNQSAANPGEVIKWNGSSWVASSDNSGALNAFVQSGNSFGAAANIGTNDTQALNLKTDSTTKMTVLANGNVGIGTINPLHKLDVSGDINISTGSNFKINGSNVGLGSVTSVTSANTDITITNTTTTPQLTLNAATTGADKILKLDGAGKVDASTLPTNIVTSSTAISGDITGTISATSIDKIKGVNLNITSLTTGNFLNYSSGSWINKNISVSDLKTIGGAQQFSNSCLASQTLVWTAITDSFMCSNIAISNTQVSGLAASATIDATNATNITSGTLNIAQLPATVTNGLWSTNASGDVSRLLGRVGIGTTDPTRPFQVIGTAVVSNENRSIASFRDNAPLAAATGGGIDFGGVYNLGGAQAEWAGIKSIKANATDGEYGAHMSFMTRQHGSGTAERMRITTNGNVGVGMSSPQAILHVGSHVPNLLGADYDVNAAYKTADVDLVIGNLTDGSTIPYIQSRSGGSSAAIGTNNYYLLIQPLGGNVGIGTTLPRSALDVNGALLVKPSVLNATSVINFLAGNLQHTASNCGAFALHNLKDGGSYTLAVKGIVSATCSFTAFSDAGITALTVHLPPDHEATTVNKHTLYSLLVMGSDVYMTWMPNL